MAHVSRSLLFSFVLSLSFSSLSLRANPEDFQKLWFPGSIEEALAQAKKEHKPILLYWGAVWCPPCNELKAEIFSKPEFLAITEPVLRVFLDGDKDEAQSWGEKLHASGYPTILLLSPEGKELFRIASSVSWDEFKQTLELALQTQGSFADALQKAQTENVPASVWKVLAYSNWLPEDASSVEKTKSLLLREKLIEKIPSEFASQKALFISGLLEAASDENRASDAEAKELWARTDKKASSYINFLLSGEPTIWASRETLVNGAKPLLSWVKKHTTKEEFSQLSARWVRAMESIRTHPSVSLDLRLWSSYPPLILSRQNSKKKNFTDPRIKSEILKAVQVADHDAKTSYERHSVISGAANLLGEVGEADAARNLLLKELKHTDTPWYYQSSLAYLEKKQRNKKKALMWSHLAKESAKGNATRLQWITSDLLLNLELAPQNTSSVNKLLQEYYELAYSLPDGFKGRNAAGAKRVKNAFAGLK